MANNIIASGFILLLIFQYSSSATEQKTLEQTLEEQNEELRLNLNLLTEARWNFETDANPTKRLELEKAQKAFDVERKKISTEMKKWIKDAPDDKKREINLLLFLGTSALDPADGQKFYSVQNSMLTNYTTASVTFNEKKFFIEPELTTLFATSNNESMLREAWIKYRDATGALMRDDFLTYVSLGNKSATKNGDILTIDDIWMFSWDRDPKLKRETENLLDELMKLYKKIHAYVRYHLKEMNYPMPNDGTIPAHLLGNMWAQSWSNLLNIYPKMRIRPDAPHIDEEANKKLKEKDISSIFDMAGEFVSTLGIGNIAEIKDKSIFEKFFDRNFSCQASSWDFFDKKKENFRIKQCVDNTMESLATLFHKIGNIECYQACKNEETAFRHYANPGIQEAIGNLIELSALSPGYILEKLGVITEISDEMWLNHQLKMALDKVVFLPFAYVMDKWRWEVFRDPDASKNLNRKWWQLRLQIQGISPPVRRTEWDFDPGAKYHIPAGIEYLRYFVGNILQFQFHEELCTEKMNEGEALHRCNIIYSERSKIDKLTSIMAKGVSQPWRTQLKDFIRTDKINLTSLNKYFEPLNAELDQFINEKKIEVGWNAKLEDYYSGTSVVSISFTLVAMVIAMTFCRLF